MARPIESSLYKELVESGFQFIERGTQDIQEIYNSAKHEFSNLCDDEYLCPHRHKTLPFDYEWKHAVRRALQRCKGKNINFSGRRGYWIFT